MPDILHKVGIKSSTTNDAYRALTTLEGLSGWWTASTKGESKVGGTIEFRFGDTGGFDMKVLELEPAKRVVWQVLAGPEEWIGTKIRFDLKQEGDFTIVLFRHEGWREPSESMHHCSTKWGTFMMSLKSLGRNREGRAVSERRPDRQLALIPHRTSAGRCRALTRLVRAESLKTTAAAGRSPPK